VSFTFGDFDRAFDHDFHHFLEVRNYEEDFNDALLNLYHKQWKRETDEEDDDRGNVDHGLDWKDSGYDEEDFKRAIEDFLDYRQQHSVAFRRNRKKSIQHRKQDTVRPYEIYDERGKLVVGKSRRRHHFRRPSPADTAARKKRIQHFNAEEKHTSPDVQQKVEDLRQSIKKKTQSTRDPSVSSNNEDAIKEAHNKDTSSSVDTNNVLVLQALDADDVGKSSVQHRINNDQVAHVNILRITADPLLDEGQSKPIIGDDEKIVQVKDSSDVDSRLDASLNSIVDKIAESARDDSKFVNHRTSQRVLNDGDSIGDRNPEVNDNNVQVASVVIDDTVDEESKKVAKLDPDTIFLETKTSTTVPSNQNITTQIAGPAHAHRKAPPDQITTDKKDKQGIDRISFIAIIAACCVAGVAGLGLAGYCWYKLRQETAEINDSPRSSSRGRPGSKGSNKGSTKGMVEDEKMAQGAEVFHYLHAKKQMNQMEPPGPKRDVVQDASDTDEDEEDTVYECPGLAPPGDMRVVNPLFSDAESHHSAGDVRSDSGSGSDPTQAHNDGIPRPPPYNRPPS